MNYPAWRLIRLAVLVTVFISLTMAVPHHGARAQSGPSNTPPPVGGPSETPAPTQPPPTAPPPTRPASTSTAAVFATPPPPTATLPAFAQLTPTPIYDPYDIPLDLTGPTPSPTPPGIIAPGDTPDLEVWAVEVTQGMQSLDNDMPLVAERVTFARIYVRTDGADYPDVKVRIQGIVDGQVMGMISADNQPIIAHGDGGDRLDPDDSLYVRLPFSWVQVGGLALRVFVYAGNPNSPFTNEPESENNFWQESVGFDAGDKAQLSFIPIHMHTNYSEEQPEKLFTQNNATFWNIALGMLRHLPFPDYDIYPPPVDQVYCYSGGELIDQLFGIDGFEEHGNCAFNTTVDGGAQYVTSMMKLVDIFTDDPAPGVNYYGMLHPDFKILYTTDEGDVLDFQGVALNGQAFGIMNGGLGNSPWLIIGANTLAHELGHRTGLGHANCAGNEEEGGGLDDNFPWTAPGCRIAQLNEEGFYGFDVLYGYLPGVNEPTVISNDPGASVPNQGWPLMGYQSDQYADAYHWCVVLETIGVDCDPDTIPFLAQAEIPSQAAASPSGISVVQLLTPGGSRFDQQDSMEGAQLIVSGSIRKSPLLASLGQIWTLAEPPGDVRPEAMRSQRESGFEVVAINADGEDLAAAPILESTINHEGMNTNHFVLELPWIDATAGIVIRTGGEILAERTFSSNPPTVELLAPNGGESFTSPFEVRWRGADPDGDPLSYALQYSADGGISWQALAFGQTGDRYRVLSLINLTGTDQGKIRVIASDGGHSAIDETDGVFSLPNTPPMPIIRSPGHLVVFKQGARVPLLGGATDREDGSLPVSALAWTSSLDGPIGEGDSLELDDLTPGNHLITLAATDSDGLSNQAQVGIVIDPFNALNLPSEGEAALADEILAAGPEWQPPTAASGAETDLDTAEPQTPSSTWLLGLAAVGGIVAVTVVTRLLRRWLRR